MSFACRLNPFFIRVLFCLWDHADPYQAMSLNPFFIRVLFCPAERGGLISVSLS